VEVISPFLIHHLNKLGCIKKNVNKIQRIGHQHLYKLQTDNYFSRCNFKYSKNDLSFYISFSPSMLSFF